MRSLARRLVLAPHVIAVTAVVAVVLSGPSEASGQSVRGWVGTTVQAVQLRPFGADPAGCGSPEQCYVLQPEQTSVAGTQDLSLTAWGFGVQGLSATLYARGRAGLGSTYVWPRSGDHFDTLLGYAQLVRGSWTGRLGRQETRSGLGFNSFDGGSASWRGGWLTVDGYGGRSLARGLRDPVNEALRGIEDFVPDQGVWLFGGAVRARSGVSSATLRYQRELLADRSGLAAERASLDGSTSIDRFRVIAGADWDFGQQDLGKGHLTVSTPFSDGRWMVSATARRYVPYFSLSTIWGFFEPVAYREALARLSWSPSTTVGVWASGGLRSYGDTRTEIVVEPIEDTGRRMEAGARWMPAPGWSVEGRYELEWGPGAFLNSGDVRVQWRPSDRFGFSANGMSFQQIEQYRLGDGRGFGAGVSADVSVAERFDFLVGGSVLKHRAEGGGVQSPWNQSRIWSNLRIRVGRDPGERNRVRR